MKKWNLVLLMIWSLTVVYGQTSVIALKSHAGKMIKMSDEKDHFGIVNPMYSDHVDSVCYFPDERIVVIYSQSRIIHIQSTQNTDNKLQNYDTLYYNNGESDKQIEENLRTLRCNLSVFNPSENVKYIGFPEVIKKETQNMPETQQNGISVGWFILILGFFGAALKVKKKVHRNHFLFSLLLLFSSSALFGQASGNINYGNNRNGSFTVRYPDENIRINMPSNPDISFSIKGLANVNADKYLAVFTATQVGKTTEEVNQLLSDRIDGALKELASIQGVKTFVDMISFVPVYELEAEKKVFSKKNYNEVPRGFELKKNIHIQYTAQSQLDAFITILSKREIYDLVRVDYFSSSLESTKRALMEKAKTLIQEKIKYYESIAGTTFENMERRINDGYKVVLPTEMYSSYQSFSSSSSLGIKSSSTINTADKNISLYYQPIMDKEFDFVINPTILEPVIQVMYEVKVVIHRESKISTNKEKEYWLITPNGELKSVLKN